MILLPPCATINDENLMPLDQNAHGVWWDGWIILLLVRLPAEHVSIATVEALFPYAPQALNYSNSLLVFIIKHKSCQTSSRRSVWMLTTSSAPNTAFLHLNGLQNLRPIRRSGQRSCFATTNCNTVLGNMEKILPLHLVREKQYFN